MSVPYAHAGPAALDDVSFLKQNLDPGFAGCREVVEAAASGDAARTRRTFAALVRATLQPERYLEMPLTFGDNAIMAEDESVAEAAERIVSGERISVGVPHRFGADVDWHTNPTPEGYEEWTWQLNRHREWVVLAEQYRRTGDARFARRIVSDLRGWRAQAPVPDDAPGDTTHSWRTIEAGIRAGATWPRALHVLLAGDVLDDETLVMWTRSYWEHGWRLRERHRTGNWLTMEMSGLVHVGILFPFFKQASEWTEYVLRTLVRELGVQVYPDGFQYELSTHTHQILLREYARVDAVCRLYAVPVPDAFHDGLERVYAVNVTMRMPDGRLPNLNNGGWHDVSELMAPSVERYPHRTDFRWAATQGDAGTPPDATSLRLPYAGYAVFRSDWSDQAVWAVFDGGPFGFRHHHEDKLNFLLHAHGRLLLTEAGKYRFDGSPMYRYTLASKGHNTVLVDGWGQNRKRRFVQAHVDVQRPAPLHWHVDTNVEAADAVYDEGYGPEADASVTHSRRVFFLRQWPGLPPCFVVVDRLRALDGREHAYEAQWHVAAEAVHVEASVASTRDSGNANLFLAASGPEPLRVVSGETEPEWRGWRVPDRGAAVPTACPTVVASWRGGDSRRLYLIVPLAPGVHTPVRGIEGADDPAAMEFAIEMADGSPTSFDERALLDGDS